MSYRLIHLFYMARPTEYKEEYVEELKQYIKDCGFELLPSVEGFALRLDVSKKTIYNWSKENEEFLHALRILKMTQREYLINRGLLGKYNSTIAKLILSANHGMVEKTNIDHTTKGDKIYEQEQIKAIAGRVGSDD